MMPPWLIIEKNGQFHQVHGDGPEPPKVKKGQRAVAVDRHTLDPSCETYDEARREWIVDAAKRERLDEEARVLAMTGAEVYAELSPRIAALEGRLAKLEADVGALLGLVAAPGAGDAAA